MRLRRQITVAFALVVAVATAASLAILMARTTDARAAAAAATLRAQERSWNAIEGIVAPAGYGAERRDRGESRLVATTPTRRNPDTLLESAAAATGAVPVLTDSDGRLLAFPAAAAKLARVAERVRGVEPGTVELVAGDRVVSVATVAVRDAAGEVTGARRWVTDVTERRWAQDRDDLLAASAVIGIAMLLTGSVTLWLRQAFRPLEQALAGLEALAQGDLTAALPGQSRDDEIGAAMRALLVFRQSRIALRRRSRADGWQRHIHGRLVEAQLGRLAATLDEPERAALLGETRGLRESVRGRAPQGEGAAGPDPLAMALRAVAERCVSLHETLRQLAAERSDALAGKARLDVLEREFSSVASLQTRLAPRPLRATGGVEVAGRLLQGPAFGGDFHDYFWLDGPGGPRLALLMASVAGSGLDAALLTMAARALVRSLAPRAQDPGECLAAVSDLLLRDNDRRAAVSAFLGFLDLGSRSLVAACAAAPPPLLLSQPGHVALLDVPAAAPLGLEPHPRVPSVTIALPARAALIAVSPGVPETLRDGVAWGMDGVAALLAGSPVLDPDGLLAHAMRGLAAPGSVRPNDASVLVARLSGAAEPWRE